MYDSPSHVLVTGGAGFIGSAFVGMLLRDPGGPRVTVLDKLTYAGNPANLKPFEGDPRFRFLRGDIAETDDVKAALDGVDVVVNFAAETHVDRSLLDAFEFIRTDVEGTVVLLEASRQAGVSRFVQISTDEVYGPIAPGESADEAWPLRPRSPYAASKAGGDLQCLAFHASYDFPVIITRGSNTYGPRQYPEKVVPLFTINAILGRALPLYGDGRQVRDWMHVEDHCAGIWLALTRGEPGTVYNIGPGDER
ncbi:MAG TPA: NAD-dependent epimerase/dehydratase family protein, partial [Dehalococcoidia bacterium]|nr:NAD-dependent epimerase/dehydratase family protein [Dehalococcoidia bacterium]